MLASLKRAMFSIRWPAMPIIDNRIQSSDLIVPARDVLHIRLHTGNTPLKGESPLCAALQDVAVSGAANAQQLAYFVNQSRPSGILSTDQVLTREQVTQLREVWNDQSQGLERRQDTDHDSRFEIPADQSNQHGCANRRSHEDERSAHRARLSRAAADPWTGNNNVCINRNPDAAMGG